MPSSICNSSHASMQDATSVGYTCSMQMHHALDKADNVADSQWNTQYISFKLELSSIESPRAKERVPDI